eukprot:TRINITY_DN45620_c0_g1_i2.p1 TRINITY_DN45620_c0_g1~~TRINITY_DN45620_c0_g1_i2.p1  ORF type:complete len:320 (+),score=50.88 TRINITY_DN45620_c0_g1_i2:264-1223(+)
MPRPWHGAVDVAGIVCVSATYVLLATEALVLLPAVLRPSLGNGAWPWLCAQYAGSALCAWAHIVCSRGDPGYLQLSLPDAERGYETEGGRCCDRCCAWRSSGSRAHHCSKCGRCVCRMDHHCIWINNCVGAGNQHHFLRFLIYIVLLCAWTCGAFLHGHSVCEARGPRVKTRGGSVFGSGRGREELLGTSSDVATATSAPAALARVFTSSEALVSLASADVTGSIESDDCRRGPERHYALAGGLGCSIALLFGLFAARALLDQVWRIAADQTGIEELKGITPSSSPPFLVSLCAVMGGPPSWTWALPVSTKRSSAKDRA